MEIKVEVPCTELVKIHLHNQYGNPVRFTRGVEQTLFHALIEKCVERTDMKKDKKEMDTAVDIQITESVYLRRGIYLTNKAVHDFNASITDMIYDALFLNMEVAGKFTKTKLKIKDCIETFCDVLRLPEECFSYERCKKAYWRHRYKNKPLKLSA